MVKSKVRISMLSGAKRYELKRQAIQLREQGESYPMIESQLEVGRGTLSGWLSKLPLSIRAKKIILTRKREHIKQARLKAVRVLGLAREANLKVVKEKVANDLSLLRFTKTTKEALLTMLYLGEGFKRRSEVGLGNSNPRILGIFVRLLREIYKVPDIRLRCFLYLRADQDQEKEKIFWSKVLHIPLSQFRKSQVDKRTLGKKTWKGYHGVCAVHCYDARIEKRLTALQEGLLEKLLMGL